MKIILTGSTGYIGGAVLAKALTHPSITSIFLLSRKPLPHLASNPKAHVIIMEDFTLYTPSVIEQLSGADACIWCLGTYDGNTHVEVDFPQAFMKAFASTLTTTPSSKPKFRFLHLGGGLTEWNQQAPKLWYLDAARKGCGLGEARTAAFAAENNLTEQWETKVAKPLAVLPSETWPLVSTGLQGVIGTRGSIKVEELGAAMVEIVVSGKGEDLIYNKALVKIGREALRAVKG